MHLLFVDDILIFWNGTLREMNMLMETLSLYRKAMGMATNKIKITISLHKLDDEEICHIIFPHI